MTNDVSVKISELTRVNRISEKDVIPFSTSLINGTETTNAVPVAILRMILANPTVYDTAELALADSKANDYLLIYADFTKSGACVYLNNGSTLQQLLDTNGEAIVLPIANSACGIKFKYRASANDTVTLPARLIGKSGYHRLIVVNETYPNIFGEYVLQKADPAVAIEMSSAIVEREAQPNKILVSWPAQLGVALTLKEQGLYSIRIY